MLSDHSKLAIAIIVYYVLALPLVTWVCKTHGFGRHAGWFYLLSLDIVRIVGAAITIAAYQHPSTGLFVAAAIFSSIGLVPLLLTLMGLMKRVNDGLRQGMMGARPFQIIHLAIIVGLILAIVAGSNSSSTNPSTLHDAQTERKAGAVILFVCAILNCLIVIYMVMHIRHVHYGDKVIVWCALLSVPFLLVRVIYIMLLAFDYKDSLFNPISPNIYIQAFMQIFMEFVCFALYTTAGLLSPKMEKGEYAGEGTELFSGRKNSELGHDARYRGQQTGVTTRV